MRANCNKIEVVTNHSIDEQIIPAKTKKSGGVRQHNPKSPINGDSKINLIRTRQSRIIYDFFLYGDKNNTAGNSCNADAIVLKLIEGIPRN